jgi:hypothetical protein
MNHMYVVGYTRQSNSFAVLNVYIHTMTMKYLQSGKGKVFPCPRREGI